MIKRLIGIVVVKDNWAVQSFSFDSYLPIGRPEVVVENLDRWQLDEILLLNIDRSENSAGPNFKLLEKLGGLGLSTPLCYMGGVRNVGDALGVLKLGADRIGIESLFYNSIREVASISEAIGKQAIVKGLSVFRTGSNLYRVDSNNKEQKVSVKDLSRWQSFFSELMIIDRKNEGRPLSFDQGLLSNIPEQLKLICFGGISSLVQVKSLLSMQNVSAIAVSNFLNYRELANLDFIDDTSRYEHRDIDYGEQTKGALDW